MRPFQALLVLLLLGLTIYTAITIANHGINLFPTFFGDIAKMGWAGQFNVDFSCFLVLSALWVSWRHQFSAAGLGLGVLAFFGGALFLSIYLLIASRHTKGNMAELLLGENRARSLVEHSRASG